MNLSSPIVPVRRICLMVSLVALAPLGACGGGGDDNPNQGSATPANTELTSSATAEAYVGTWLSPCSLAESTTSYRGRAVITRISDKVIRMTDYGRNYATSTTCSGNFTESPEGHIDLSIVGTKVVDGKTVDKISAVNNAGETSKLIAYVAGKDMYIGAGGVKVARDSEGFPIQLSTTAVFQRQ
jgi:hypothetical protein